MWRRATPLVLVLAAASCGECTACAGRGEVEHEENGRAVTIVAQGYTDVGVGGFGAPHAFGVLYPTFGGGHAVSMQVDDRPPVLVGRGGDGRTPGDEEMQAEAESVAVSVAPDGAHVAATYHGHTHVFHLLAEGTPFDAPGSHLAEGASLDWSAFSSPEEIVRAFLEDDAVAHDEYALLWDAVEAQPPDAARDVAVVSAWPESDRAHALLIARVSGGGDAPLRAALSRAARAAIRAADRAAPAGPAPRADAMVHAEEALVALGGEDLGWLDAQRIEAWGDADAPPGQRRVALGYLERRLGRHREALGEPPPRDRDAPLLAAARRVLAHRRPSTHRDVSYERRAGVTVYGASSNDELFFLDRDLTLALHLLRRRGGEAGHEAALAYLREEWPAQDISSLDDAVTSLVEERPGDAAITAMVTAGAERSFARDPDVRAVANVAFAVGDPTLSTKAHRALVQRFDQVHCYTISEHLDQATPEAEDAILAKVDELLPELEGEGSPSRPRYDIACGIGLAVQIRGERGASCEELAALLEARGRTGAFGRRPELPERCVTPPTE